MDYSFLSIAYSKMNRKGFEQKNYSRISQKFTQKIIVCVQRKSDISGALATKQIIQK